MLRISQLKMNLSASEGAIRAKAAKVLGISETEIREFHIRKESVDARKKPELFLIYTVDIAIADEKRENALLAKLQKKKTKEDITKTPDESYHFPDAGKECLSERPVIVGMGPAGLFCAYLLAENGYAPLVIERGAPVEERTKDVEEFWKSGVLKPDSNVQFGEGGAGTFSDGKLGTLIKDPGHRIREVLRIFVKCGAPSEILYQNKPHIGTDVLTEVIRNMREYIFSCGGEVKYHTTFTGYKATECGKLKSVLLIDNQNGEELVLPTDVLVLAPGHSARDTFFMLHESGMQMEAKPFAIGMRAEHSQKLINRSQYGADQVERLGAAPYKLTEKLNDGRGIYSFCMCPGGYVVNASSEDGLLAVNGMSYQDRGSHNANSAIVISVTPDDYPDDSPLAGIKFQRELERKAYALGGGMIPRQRYGDFYQSAMGAEKEFGLSEEVPDETCVKGAYKEADLTKLFGPELSKDFVEGMEKFDLKIHGFAAPEVLLSGIESRTSSPVRIVRDSESLMANISGIYPCGEGAGYAGGITSAACDGMKVAESIRIRFRPFYRHKF